MGIEIENLLKDCNGVINRKLVVFQRMENKYFVYIVVAGFDVDSGDIVRTPRFTDRLPLYVIPEEKLQEHLDLFNQTFYDIEVKDK